MKCGEFAPRSAPRNPTAKPQRVPRRALVPSASRRKGRTARPYPGACSMMIGEVTVMNEWIPEQMQPGTMFVLENAGEIGEQEDPYWAVLACPSCGTLGLITQKQMAGLLPTICGSAQCSAQFFIKDE